MTRSLQTNSSSTGSARATARLQPAAARPRLRQLLVLDAAVTGVNGLAYVLAAAPLESLLGVSADLLRPIGAFLVAYGVAVAIVAVRRDISRWPP